MNCFHHAVRPAGLASMTLGQNRRRYEEILMQSIIVIIAVALSTLSQTTAPAKIVSIKGNSTARPRVAGEPGGRSSRRACGSLSS